MAPTAAAATAEASSPRMALSITYDILTLLVLLGLDVRDLWYKIQWIGPGDAFAFTATGVDVLEQQQLVPNLTLPLSTGAMVVRNSGWTSMLTTCAGIQSFGSPFFLHALNSNCSLPGIASHTTAILPKLIISGGVRVDSMAWAACKMLFAHRKPPLCHETVVADFLDRYHFSAEALAPDQYVAPLTDAEGELLELLDVISKSVPLYATTCFEGFEYRGPGVYSAHVFGCASPTIYASAFVGHYATGFKDLHNDKAWLTLDDLNFMGLRFEIRQNVISVFNVDQIDSANGPTLQLQHTTLTNFSSTGFLYSVMLAIDVLLLYVHASSWLEIAQLILQPLWTTTPRNGGTPEEGEGLFEIEDYSTFFTCSLYRSTPVVLLTIASQLLSWVLVIPNAVIWTWNESAYGRMQAMMSTIRFWLLVLLSFNQLWDVVVYINERLAYRFARRTYITSLEMLAVTVLATYLFRDQLFAISEVKYALEHQRHLDSHAFADHLAFGNAYNEAIEHLLSTPTHILAVVYRPLVSILLLALALVLAVLIVRFLYFSFKFRHRRRLQVVQSPARSRDRDTATVVAAMDPPYERLPLEDLLDVPIRARSIVRGRIELERMVDGELYLRPPQYLEHGVMVESGKFMRIRRGFYNVLQTKLDVEEDAAKSSHRQGSVRNRKHSAVSLHRSKSSLSTILR
ncbi:TPA: hypothetical protein N0F65_011508 [Lagenidium giganteum]|uniref:Uncharacterized protein n=1 Tax=Lagenidium giganteum TaxID=4803 RepID=A0AAV2Z4D8_9STRA|nr:TPA: hypothetical protein N0F65_011508 [Lagenidium giganteum]